MSDIDINSRIYWLGYWRGASREKPDLGMLTHFGYSPSNEENVANFLMGHADGQGDVVEHGWFGLQERHDKKT